MEPLIECEDETNCDKTIQSCNECIQNQLSEQEIARLYEKSELDEKIQRNNKLYSSDDQPLKACIENSKCSGIENQSDEYDKLPADPEERFNFFVEEYRNILNSIRTHNCMIAKCQKQINIEEKSMKNKSTVDKLKVLCACESDKIDSLLKKASRIQRLYPRESWEPLPLNHKKEIQRMLLDDKKFKIFCQTTSTFKNSIKTTSRSSSATSLQSNQASICKSNTSTTRKSIKENKALAIRNTTTRNPTSNVLTPTHHCVLREGNSISSMRFKDNFKENIKSIKINGNNKKSTCNSNINKISNSTTKKRSSNKDNVKDKYNELIDVLRYKENELQDMLDTIEETFETHLSRQSQGDNGNLANDTQPSIKFLQKKVSLLQLEQKEFRRQIRAQQDDIEKYQKKFFEQKQAIDTLESSNKMMENDINSVIVNLKESYETKLRELSAFPKLLKIEKQKLETVTRDKREIETKFKLLTKEFEYIKEKLEEKSKKVHCSSSNRIRALKRELLVFKNFNSALREERDRLGNELRTTKSELDAFRVESNKLLFRTRDQAETQRRLYQKKINELQSELLTNRASNTCFVKQRNKIIVDIQSQLNNLKDNFQISQSHIDNLKKHISTLSMSNPCTSQSETFIS